MLVAAPRTHPMLITAIGIFPLIALVVVAMVLHPVVASVVYAVSVSILITVLTSFIVAIIVVIVIVRPRHAGECERHHCCQRGQPEALQHSGPKHNHLSWRSFRRSLGSLVQWDASRARPRCPRAKRMEPHSTRGIRRISMMRNFSSASGFIGRPIVAPRRLRWC